MAERKWLPDDLGDGESVLVWFCTMCQRVALKPGCECEAEESNWCSVEFDLDDQGKAAAEDHIASRMAKEREQSPDRIATEALMPILREMSKQIDHPQLGAAVRLEMRLAIPALAWMIGEELRNTGHTQAVGAVGMAIGSMVSNLSRRISPDDPLRTGVQILRQAGIRVDDFFSGDIPDRLLTPDVPGLVVPKSKLN